ncbi:CBL-interacting serine/threonine-protein kinase 1 isoform X1 [Zea mays]|uniref:CBL-interacting serine/threonine-protein kinase 1 isoform X1 n=1 Tax=Zea mays TaxID=4577 RepID=UPI0004DEAFA6|nr:CBL-interacting serine/threonine-protein kinase 1 isoform X1 [Zea mays]|eukprot:XP_008667916.1 CBL-interacting serine/threonine-protein kinase 1 isoform X1 [Zea mays]
MRMGKYEMGRTLGEGHFGKVRLARHADTGRPFAIKILDRQRILAMKIHDQIKREIATLKLLKHPNVVRLYEVSASKTKIYMVLEYVNGGELFDKIALKGKLTEKEGRKLFQQLIDAVGYCHEKGVYHRDLKPENVLVDAKGNIKVSDFGLSALPQNQQKDGLLHTTCGSPNYIAPEVLLNKGYDGSISDVWSCGVILYVMLTGNLPFDDQNVVVLYQKILKGNAHIPKWLSQGAQDILRKILDPNPVTRIDVDGIRAHDWFKQGYAPAMPFSDDEEDISMDEDSLNITEVTYHNDIQDKIAINQINAFQLIGMSSCLDLSGFFEKEDVSERKIRFASNYSPAYLFEKIESIVRKMGFQVHKSNGKLKVIQDCKGLANSRGQESLLISAEVFEINEYLYVVELKKSSGDCSLYRKLCETLSEDLGTCKSQQFLKQDSIRQDIGRYNSSF